MEVQSTWTKLKQSPLYGWVHCVHRRHGYLKVADECRLTKNNLAENELDGAQNSVSLGRATAETVTDGSHTKPET